jgi:hypothetical protein
MEPDSNLNGTDEGHEHAREWLIGALLEALKELGIGSGMAGALTIPAAYNRRILGQPSRVFPLPSIDSDQFLLLFGVPAAQRHFYPETSLSRVRCVSGQGKTRSDRRPI